MEKVKAAIIGCGARAQAHAGAALAGNVMDIVYACDVQPERAGKSASQWGARPASDYREVLADGGVEAVIIATNVEPHLPIAREAIEAGKHVILEKPIGDDVRAARELVERAKSSRTVAYMSFQMRFSPRHALLKAIAEKIDPVQILFERQRGMMKPQYLNDSPFCGICDVVAHDFDQVMWLMDRPPVAVSAVMRRDTFTEGTEAADTLSALVDFGDGRSALICSSIGAAEVGQRIDMIGACGNVSLGDRQEDAAVTFDRYNVRFGTSEGRTPIDLNANEDVNPDAALQKAFVEEVRTGTKSPAARLADGLNSLLLTLGCVRSAREGSRVGMADL